MFPSPRQFHHILAHRFRYLIRLSTLYFIFYQILPVFAKISSQLYFAQNWHRGICVDQIYRFASVANISELVCLCYYLSFHCYSLPVSAQILIDDQNSSGDCSLYCLIQPIKLCPKLNPKDVQNSRDKFKAFSRPSLFILQYISFGNPAICSSISLAFNFVHYVRVSTVTFSTGHGQYRNFQL